MTNTTEQTRAARILARLNADPKARWKARDRRRRTIARRRTI